MNIGTHELLQFVLCFNCEVVSLIYLLFSSLFGGSNVGRMVHLSWFLCLKGPQVTSLNSPFQLVHIPWLGQILPSSLLLEVLSIFLLQLDTKLLLFFYLGCELKFHLYHSKSSFNHIISIYLCELSNICIFCCTEMLTFVDVCGYVILETGNESFRITFNLLRMSYFRLREMHWYVIILLFHFELILWIMYPQKEEVLNETKRRNYETPHCSGKYIMN